VTPSDDAALEALRVLRGWLGLGADSSAPTSYTQDALPPGISRGSFLRRHSKHVRQGTAGWSRVGHGRVVTAEAWSLDVAIETRRRPRLAKTLAVVPDVDTRLDEAFGIRIRKTGAG
jgi:hypothetical protein